MAASLQIRERRTLPDCCRGTPQAPLRAISTRRPTRGTALDYRFRGNLRDRFGLVRLPGAAAGTPSCRPGAQRMDGPGSHLSGNRYTSHLSRSESLAGRMMGIAHRIFLIDPEDRLYRLANAKFCAMLQAPTRHRFLQFAGRRIRSAGATIELIDRRPTEVLRVTFDIATFDERGCLDRDLYLQQQSSRAELAMATMIFGRPTNSAVVDAASRYVAHGGRWTPSRFLARAIEDAALGRTRSVRL